MKIALIIITLMLVGFSSYGYGDPQVPCYFIFGDSLSDAGNNVLATAAKANYMPYGVDFPGAVATGRFTNGQTFVDVLTFLLGFEKFIPPFSNSSGQDILQGVNFASGAAGIREETGSNLGDRVWFDRQILNFVITIARLRTMVKGPVDDYLNKCLYTVYIGNNDYINNYFMPQAYPTKTLFTPAQFAQALINQYEIQLKALYLLGARKIAIFGLGQVGCAPAVIARNMATGCVAEVNSAVQLFNQKLPSLVDSLNARLRGANFTFIDTNATQSASPPPPDLILDKTCCVVRSDFQCEPLIPPCANRMMYAFYDGFHTTEIINMATAVSAYNTPNPSFVHPVDISHLVST